jgi:hypothetical protein
MSDNFQPETAAGQYLAEQQAARDEQEASFAADVRHQLLQQKAEQKLSTGDAALNQAVEQLKEERWNNIHERAYQQSFGMTTDRPPAEPEAFDAAKFSAQFGLPENYLEGVKDEKTAKDALNTYYSDEFGDVPFEQARMQQQIAAGQAELAKRVDAQYDQWRSPKYGHTGAPLTASQLAERQRLGDAAIGHAQALMESGQRVPHIEALLSRVRYMTDAEYRPSFRKQPTYSNIHQRVLQSK